MKRVALVMAAVFAMFSIMVFPAAAADDAGDDVIYYDDGSYAVVTIGNGISRATKDDLKTYTFYNSSGQRCFAYTLYGFFTYNGTTSQATSANYGVVIYRQGWELKSHSEYVSGSTAYGRAVFTGPNGETRNVSLTLTCDKNGNVT